MNRHLAAFLNFSCKEVLIIIPPPHLCLVCLMMRQITCTVTTDGASDSAGRNVICCISQIKDGS